MKRRDRLKRPIHAYKDMNRNELSAGTKRQRISRPPERLAASQRSCSTKSVNTRNVTCTQYGDNQEKNLLPRHLKIHSYIQNMIGYSTLQTNHFSPQGTLMSTRFGVYIQEEDRTVWPGSGSRELVNWRLRTAGDDPVCKLSPSRITTLWNGSSIRIQLAT